MQKYKAPTFDEYNKVMAHLDKPKTSNPIMTKYEFSIIISTRANQISLGAQPFVDVSDLNIKSNMELRKVAIRELKAGRLPFMIKRPLPPSQSNPNSKFEYIRVRDMNLVRVLPMMRDEDNEVNVKTD